MAHRLVPFFLTLAKLGRWAVLLIVAGLVATAAALQLQGLSIDKATMDAAVVPLVVAGMIAALAELAGAMAKSCIDHPPTR